MMIYDMIDLNMNLIIFILINVYGCVCVYQILKKLYLSEILSVCLRKTSIWPFIIFIDFFFATIKSYRNPNQLILVFNSSVNVRLMTISFRVGVFFARKFLFVKRDLEF